MKTFTIRAIGIDDAFKQAYWELGTMSGRWRLSIRSVEIDLMSIKRPWLYTIDCYKVE